MEPERYSILDKVLVTGGGGTIASYIDFGMKVGRNEFDITDLSKTIEFIKKNEPRTIIHLAAETDLNKCELDQSHSYMTNAVGAYNLGVAAKEVGAKLVYVSTDAVFPHSDKPHSIDDPINPESVYGHSKYLGELAVKGICSDYIIARTAWIFGGGKNNDKKFVAKFISQLNNPLVSAVNDQYGSPTYAKDFVFAVKDLILKDEKGLFHVVNSGTASRYDMAWIIAETLNTESRVNSVSSSTYGVLPYQQSSGGLVPNIKLRSWQEALKEYLEVEWLSSGSV